MAVLSVVMELGHRPCLSMGSEESGSEYGRGHCGPVDDRHITADGLPCRQEAGLSDGCTIVAVLQALRVHGPNTEACLPAVVAAAHSTLPVSIRPLFCSLS